MKKQIKEFILEDDIRYIGKKNTKNNITINYNKELKNNILIGNISLIFGFIYMISLFIIEEKSKYINSYREFLFTISGVCAINCVNRNNENSYFYFFV